MRMWTVINRVAAPMIWLTDYYMLININRKHISIFNVIMSGRDTLLSFHIYTQVRVGFYFTMPLVSVIFRRFYVSTYLKTVLLVFLNQCIWIRVMFFFWIFRCYWATPRKTYSTRQIVFLTSLLRLNYIINMKVRVMH